MLIDSAMSCPLYREDRYVRCRAVTEEVTPTLYEREHYCRAEDFSSCPTLRLMLRLHRRLRESEYYEIYVPPRSYAATGKPVRMATPASCASGARAAHVPEKRRMAITLRNATPSPWTPSRT